MKILYKVVIVLVLLASFLAGLALIPVVAATGGYQLSWGGASSGGGEISGGSYAVTSSIAMPNAAPASGGSYTVIGSTVPVPDPYEWIVMVPLIKR